MTGIFKQKTPANILLLLIFGICIKLPAFIHPHVAEGKPEDSILYQELLRLLQPVTRTSPVLFPIMAYALLFLQALTLTRFINNQRMMSRPTYFPGMAYMLITSLMPEWNYFSAPLIVNTILLFILSALFKTYNQAEAKASIFNAGMALGIASFIFFPAISFALWILLALMVMRPLRINEWLICLLGVSTPFYFYAVYLFVDDKWSWHNLVPYFSFRLPQVQQSVWLAGSVFLVAVPFLAGGYYVQDSLRKMLIQVRKGWSLLLLYLLCAMLVPFINNTTGFENWIVAAVPFAAFHACTYYYSPLRIVPLLLFWLTVAFILGYQYGAHGWT